MRATERDATLARAAEVIKAATSHTKLLDAIAWPRRVEREFFATRSRFQSRRTRSIARGSKRAYAP